MHETTMHLRNAAISPPETEHIDRQDRLFSGYFEEADGYRRYRSRGCETHLLFYTISGCGFLRGEDGTVTKAEPGDLHICPPGVRHDYGTWPESRWGFHWIHFHARPSWTEWLRLAPSPGIAGLGHASVRSAEAHKRIVRALGDIHRDTTMDTVWRNELAMNNIERLLLLVGETTGAGTHPMDPRIQAVLERIATSPADDHSVPRLARSISLSPARFAHLFKTETGRTPQRFVSEVRLREAATLVAMTTMPIADVATAVGYASAFHFSSAFRARHGVSPRTYRAGRARPITADA